MTIPFWIRRRCSRAPFLLRGVSPRGRRIAEQRDEEHLQDGAENAMSIRIGYLLPTRERIMAEQPQAAPLLELAERAERVSVPLRCASWRASPSARRRVAAAGSRPAGAVACRRRSPDDQQTDPLGFGREHHGGGRVAGRAQSARPLPAGGFHR